MDFERTLEGVQRWEVFFRCGKEAMEEGDLKDAELQLNRALKSAEKYGDEDPRLANIHNALGELYGRQESYEKAEEHYRKVITIWEKAFGENYSGLMDVLGKYAGIITQLNRADEADAVYNRIEAIRNRQM